MIKSIHVQGSHYECGYQIGSACTEQLISVIEGCKGYLPSGFTWEDARKASLLYLEITRGSYGEFVDEIRGTADGAGIDFLDLFTSSIEEVYPTSKPAEGCTDIIACAPATAGDVLIAHNNDLDPSDRKNLVAVEWNIADQPALWTVGPGGVFISAGVNENKIALTGNELNANDEKIGVPRAIIARAILKAESFEEALRIALDPMRASSYNNIISEVSGKVVNVEASGTDYELMYPQNGWLIHTNHYVHPRMQKYENNPALMKGSHSRYDRGVQLTQSCAVPVTGEMLQSFMKDHASEQAICRHGDETQTVFSIFIALNKLEVWISDGNPCCNEFSLAWQG